MGMSAPSAAPRRPSRPPEKSRAAWRLLSSLERQNDECPVVGGKYAPGVRGYGRENRLPQACRIRRGLVNEERLQPLEAEGLTVAVDGFDEAVGHEDQAVARG